jgi:hypothetical protein
MLKDVEIKELSAEVDEVLAILALKYKLSPLSLSAVVNARLICANREAGSERDFIQLLTTITGKTEHGERFTNYSMH